MRCQDVSCAPCVLFDISVHRVPVRERLHSSDFCMGKRYCSRGLLSEQLPLLLSVLARTYAPTSLVRLSVVCMLRVLCLLAGLGALDAAAILCLLFSIFTQTSWAKRYIFLAQCWQLLSPQATSCILVISYVLVHQCIASELLLNSAASECRAIPFVAS